MLARAEAMLRNEGRSFDDSDLDIESSLLHWWRLRYRALFGVGDITTDAQPGSSPMPLSESELSTRSNTTSSREQDDALCPCTLRDGVATWRNVFELAFDGVGLGGKAGERPVLGQLMSALTHAFATGRADEAADLRGASREELRQRCLQRIVCDALQLALGDNQGGGNLSSVGSGVGELGNVALAAAEARSNGSARVPDLSEVLQALKEDEASFGAAAAVRTLALPW